MTGYIGTYTESSYGGRGKGIYAFSLREDTGELTDIRLIAEMVNPSYLALSPDERRLYAVNERGGEAGAVSACALDSGGARLLGTRASGGADPCHLALGGGFLAVSNYTSGTLSVFPTQPDGSLGEALGTLTFRGSGPNPARQKEAHAHSFLFTSSDSGFCFDLGSDTLRAVSLRGPSAQPASDVCLTAPPFAPPQSGAGPRHGLLHPTRPILYVLGELDSALHVFSGGSASRALTERACLSTREAASTGENTAAALKPGRGGRYLYASNRGDNSITLFALDASGLPRFVETIPSGGKTPRDISLSPSGAYLLAANQHSDNITIFKTDPATGRLTQTGSHSVPTPVCLLFRKTRAAPP